MALSSTPCAAGCGTPMDAFLETIGLTMHPMCEHELEHGHVSRTPRRSWAPEPTGPLPAADDAEPLPDLPGKGSKVRAVYDAIEQAGRRGLTDREGRVACAHIEQSISGIGVMVGWLLITGAVVRAPILRDGQDVYVAHVHVPVAHRRR